MQMPTARNHETPQPAKRRTLYFDIDGTLVHQTFDAAKRRLASGAFERAVRRARFDRLVCVSDAASIARAHRDAGITDDPYDVVFELCRGTIQDRDWFDRMVELVPDPVHRALAIDPRDDWYYVDDFARRYLWRSYSKRRARQMLRSGRVLRCAAGGGGDDVLGWLASLQQPLRSYRPWRAPYGIAARFSPNPAV